MRIVIETDLEGVSGVCVWEQTRDRESRLYPDACEYLMGDVSAAVQGCLEGGASDIIVMDGHGGGFNFVPRLMHSGARYFTGRNRRPISSWSHIMEGMDASILLGFHAMAGTPDGILRHTQSSQAGNRYWYNGRECGEIAQSALFAGHFGVPVIMVTGDTAATREATAFLGASVVTVSVKEGLGEQFGLLAAPKEARQWIKEGARQAMGKIQDCRPFVMDTPIMGLLRFPDKSTADSFQPKRSRRVDDYTFEAGLESALEVYAF